MVSKLWFRFGIPLGSATTLAGLLDFAMSSYWFLNDFGSYLYIHEENNIPTKFQSIVSLVAVSSRLVLTLLLWIFILLGQRAILLFWIPLSVITDIVIVVHGINNSTHDGFISDEIWFVNIAVVILVRSYITCVLYQAFYRLLQNARAEAALEKEKTFEIECHPNPNHNQINNGNIRKPNNNKSLGPEDPNVLRSSSSSSYNTALNGKAEDNNGGMTNSTSGQSNSSTGANATVLIIEKTEDVTTIWENLGHIGKKTNNIKRTLRAEPSGPGGSSKVVAAKGLLASSANPRFLLIEPIGFSPSEIWEFYNDIPRLGAAVLVWFEVIWNIFALSTHSLTEFLLGGGMFFMIREEEIFMRVWRIAVDVVALIFIFKRRKTMLRFWLIIYFWTLFASLCIFVYIMADWVDPPPITVIVTCVIWMGDNCVRFGVLYFCLRVTTQHPISPLDSPGCGGGHEVGRSHSLRSQTRPMRSRKRKQQFGGAQIKRIDSLEQLPAPVNSSNNCSDVETA